MSTTRTLAVDPDDPDPASIDEAAAILRAGGLVAFATETVYGLGADATNPEALARIFAAKGRPASNPLIVHVESRSAATACVADWPVRADLLADRFWPGPLTLVLPRSAIIPDLVTAGQGTVGIRVPLPKVARELIRRAGRPIAAPSANRSTGVSPTSAAHVLKDLDGKVDLILDAGPVTIGIESTVLDLSGPNPIVLRPGRVTQEELAEALGEPVGRLEAHRSASELSQSPGQMSIHYAPRKPAYRIDRDRWVDQSPGSRTLVVAIGPEISTGPDGPIHLQIDDPDRASSRLYQILHDLDDDPRYDALAIIPPPDEPRWRAIRDRIWRSTKVLL